MKAKLLLGLSAIALLVRVSSAEEPRVDDLRLVGLMSSSKQFVVFVAFGAQTKQLTALGSAIGPFELAAVDASKGCADFKCSDGSTRRVWLPDSHVKPRGAGTDDITMSITLLRSMKGVLGLDEAIARRGEAFVLKTTGHTINMKLNDPKLSLDQRAQYLADLLSGKQHNILVPPGGVDQAFAKKYGLSPQEVENANWGEEVGQQYVKSRKHTASSVAPVASQNP